AASSGKHSTSMKTCFLLRPPPEVRVPRTRVRPPGRGWASPEYENSACAIGLAPFDPWGSTLRNHIGCHSSHRSLNLSFCALHRSTPCPAVHPFFFPRLVDCLRQCIESFTRAVKFRAFFECSRAYSASARRSVARSHASFSAATAARILSARDLASFTAG